MTMSVVMAFILWAIGVLIGLLLGYLTAYSRKKGENLATHEDIGKLVDQVRAVTTATKQIEEKISNEMWDRQRRWELKRDAVFEAVKHLGAIDDALMTVHTTFSVASAPTETDPSRWTEYKSAALDKWNLATPGFDAAKLLASLVCGKEVRDGFYRTSLLMRDIADKMLKGNVQAYKELSPKLAEEMNRLNVAIRKELRLDELSATSASPAPTRA